MSTHKTISAPLALMAFGIATCLVVFWKFRKIGTRSKDYPPGPPTLPFIGNLHQMPKGRGHLQFQKWAEEYGPVYSLVLGTKVVVVLSSDVAVKDLLDKRSAIYSSRPEFYLGQEVLSGNLRPLFLQYGNTWRLVRKLAHGVLNIQVARSYVPYQDLENRAMLMGFLEAPGQFFGHIRRYTTSLTTQMTFGYRTPTSDDPNLVEMFEKESGISDELACYMSGSLLQAGSETTSAILIGFIEAILLFPEVAKVAQAEIDRVCGDRMPDLNDVPELPYIRGCMKESLRWMPAAVLGVPHAVIQDDLYQGYRIPKGASVLFNVWAIHNDPRRHPDPRRYDPSRWAGDDQNSIQAALNADPTKRDHFTFGAGMSRILWAFNVNRAVDEKTGKEILPDINNVVDGLFVCPQPFPANIVPRSASRAARVREEWAQVQHLLDENKQWKVVPEGLKWRDYEPLGGEEGVFDVDP
ncbi:hypothetical protein GQX73_g10544 [Xylaria multiplex]|uniref:Cytochrome P450 n=1 Tax=Xylaria multiplex TaxID=323545 RepID=A0A7C8MLF7_9PEZI|nr:hypothetical protein GQX73_g10544 [Xylaria multiplex]